MDKVFSVERTRQLHEQGIIAVLVIDNPADAVPVAKALVAGGVRSMELALRTEAAMEALKLIIAEVPEMVAGVGTIITPEQVRNVKDIGAAFGVAPGFNQRVVEEAIRSGLSFAPGVSTASEIEAAVELGCRVLKFFPAEQMGGVEYLDAVNNPYAYLDLQFIPLGGISMDNLSRWLLKPYILAVGGSWIASRQLIARKAWDEIGENAERAVGLSRSLRG